ncbi:MAG: OmpA family protein [Proteobacteria bacterium]|nr:OmpA family protein [Pseudomonadota bacterium]
MKCSITMAIAVILFTCTGVVHAQEAQENDRSFNVQNFRLAPGYGAFLTVEGANVMPDYLGFQVGGFLNYQYRPPSLVVQTCEREESEDCVWDDNALIEHHFSLELLAAFSIYNVFEVGLALPVVLYQNGETAADVEGLSANAGISDLRLHLKLDILQGLVHYTRKDLSLAFITVLSFPTGNAANPDAFMGDSGVTVEHKAAFGARFGRYRIGANLGYLWRETKEFYLKEIGPRLTYGVAVEVDLVKRWAVVAELFGQLGFTFDLASAPLEADFAARYDIGRHGLVATAGMGVGILAGVGTPVIRLFGGVMWTPQLNMDRDKDGIPDKDDGCPKDPEDKDNFEDADGCPDPDNDADGILDAEDGCPGEPEDMDDFEDVDGCPDPDNDGDGILDTDDVCPDEPEDMDDFEDVNGCPDPDNDGDGFPDQTDKCPDQAEVLNGFEDEDGCPDKGKQLVVVQEEKIRLLEKVRFATNSDRIIGKQSFDILISVAAVLKSRPAVKIRIEGHTDAVGSAQANRSLSERRADFVMNYLIKQGVEPDRLEAVGYGPDRPIAPNKTLAGRDTNRRVEFVITAQ